jgi:hypothetical protein
MSTKEVSVSSLFAFRCAVDQVKEQTPISLVVRVVDEKNDAYEITAEPDRPAPKTMRAFVAAMATREALLEEAVEQDILLTSSPKVLDHAQMFVTASGLDSILGLPNTHLTDMVWPEAA